MIFRPLSMKRNIIRGKRKQVYTLHLSVPLFDLTLLIYTLAEVLANHIYHTLCMYIWHQRHCYCSYSTQTVDKSMVAQGAFHWGLFVFILLSTGLNFLSHMLAKRQLFSVVGVAGRGGMLPHLFCQFWPDSCLQEKAFNLLQEFGQSDYKCFLHKVWLEIRRFLCKSLSILLKAFSPYKLPPAAWFKISSLSTWGSVRFGLFQ